MDTIRISQDYVNQEAAFPRIRHDICVLALNVKREDRGEPCSPYASSPQSYGASPHGMPKYLVGIAPIQIW
jgi:hypothetical protein